MKQMPSRPSTILSKLRPVINSLDSRLGLIFLYILLVAAVALILYWRFPNNVTQPNFYGEDGSVYLQNILDKGWLKAALTPFNGYAIIGLYILEAVGWIVNVLIFGGGLLTLPAVFAATAIAFMAAVVSLPYLLFHRTFGKVRMGLVVLFSAFLPLPLSPHVVIGTVGNQKWVFFYLAFLLALYRIINHKRLRLPALLAIDGLLLISAYTNSTVYTLMPLLLLPYVRDYWRKRKRTKLFAYLQKGIRSFDLISLVILGFLLIPQLVYVGLHGIPKLPGYLDNPFRPGAAIEVFINRTYLFGATHIVNGFMSDMAAILLFGIILYVGFAKLRDNQLLVFIAGLYAAGMASILFVLNRPGVSDFFHGYQSAGSGPDQFFFVQTLIMYLPLVLVLGAVVRNFPKKWFRHVSLGLASLLIVAAGLASNAIFGEQWRNASVFENDAGTFIDQAIASCAQTKQDNVRVTVYPYISGQFALSAPSNQICNDELAQYQPGFRDLGLRPWNNEHLPVTDAKEFTQTFTTHEPGLNGIRLFVSSFGQGVRRGNYTLELRDSSCSQIIRKVSLSNKTLDNSFYNIRFPSIADSDGKTYCFSLAPPTGDYDRIAVQHSAPDIYLEGVLTENDASLSQDVVFMPLFEQKY